MLEYLDSRKNAAQALMEKILLLSGEDIAKANLRDKMGALKILADVFAVKSDGVPNGEKGAVVNIVIEDTSGERDDEGK